MTITIRISFLSQPKNPEPAPQGAGEGGELSLMRKDYTMPSEAQKRATAKYNREKMVQKVVRFSPNERDLLAYLESKENMAGYIKSLIRADMEGCLTVKDK